MALQTKNLLALLLTVWVGVASSCTAQALDDPGTRWIPIGLLLVGAGAQCVLLFFHKTRDEILVDLVRDMQSKEMENEIAEKRALSQRIIKETNEGDSTQVANWRDLRERFK